MSNEERAAVLKKRTAAVTMVLCFVAVIAFVGAYTFSNYQKQQAQQLADAQTALEEIEEETRSTTADEIVLPESEDITSNTEEALENVEAESALTEDDLTDQVSTEVAHEVWFSEDSILEWPASGSVIIDYSMDQSVYFSTLDQYKYNPALIISGNVGENIGAAAAGIVTAVEQDAQTGLTVTLDMGNGYSATYGQLKEVPVAVGDYVETKQIVGYLSEPTKYYSVEGANLYFQVTKDGEPVNPLDFMEG
ncbi:MAG: peptidoglycan DD-metalloendopeptidase family protein [Ruminococcus sp.]|nr:peptidoglycan DD-metalloendopeptidase family protein [Ruminococcus sp.]